MRYRKRRKKCGADVGIVGFFALRFLLQQSSVAAIRRVFQTGSPPAGYQDPAAESALATVRRRRGRGSLDECRRKHGE